MSNHHALSATALLALSLVLAGCGGGGGGEVANPFSPPGTTQPPASDGSGSESPVDDVGGNQPPANDGGGNEAPADNSDAGGSPVGGDKLTLKWSAGPAVGWYEIYYGKTADRTRMQLLEKAYEPAAHFDILRDLSALPGDEVCFRVKAFNNVTASGFSDAVCTII